MVFDTAFHQTVRAAADRNALRQDLYTAQGVRRCGFHGTSRRYVAEQAAAFLARPLGELRRVTLHLGNGASVAAGRCIDTSMGLTPLEGRVMGTRRGDIDPAIPAHPQRTAVGDPRAELAVAVYVHRIKRYLGAFLAVLGGAHAAVFTGGVGENAAGIRALSCSGLEQPGISLDTQANGLPLGQRADVSRAESRVRILVIRTNEKLQIARETLGAVQAAFRAQVSAS